MEAQPHPRPWLRLFAGTWLGFLIGAAFFLFGLRLSFFKNSFFENATHVFNFGFEGGVITLFFVFWMMVIPFLFVGALLTSRKHLSILSESQKRIVRWSLATPLGWSVSAVLHVLLQQVSGSTFDSMTQPMAAVVYALGQGSRATTVALWNIALFGLVLTAITVAVMTRLGPLRADVPQTISAHDPR